MITVEGTLVPVAYGNGRTFELWSDTWRIPLAMNERLLPLARKCVWEDVRIALKQVVEKSIYDVQSIRKLQDMDESDGTLIGNNRDEEDWDRIVSRYGKLEMAV